MWWPSPNKQASLCHLQILVVWLPNCPPRLLGSTAPVNLFTERINPCILHAKEKMQGGLASACQPPATNTCPWPQSLIAFAVTQLPVPGHLQALSLSRGSSLFSWEAQDTSQFLGPNESFSTPDSSYWACAKCSLKATQAASQDGGPGQPGGVQQGLWHQSLTQQMSTPSVVTQLWC